MKSADLKTIALFRMHPSPIYTTSNNQFIIFVALGYQNQGSY